MKNMNHVWYIESQEDVKQLAEYKKCMHPCPYGLNSTCMHRMEIEEGEKHGLKPILCRRGY